MKVGDKVTVHKPTNIHQCPTWNKDMDKYIGKTGTVKRRICLPPQICSDCPNGSVVVNFGEDYSFEFRIDWCKPVNIQLELPGIL